MKTKEFVKRVEELGFWVQELNNIINVCKYKEGVYLVTIDKHNQYMLDNRCKGFIDLDDYERSELLKLCYEYARTPIEEREEEKRYYLRHRYLQSSQINRNNILSYSETNNQLALGNGITFPKLKSEFTLKEIEEIKKETDSDLSDFELVEVEE